jgi:hypothetical protein
MEVIVEKTSLHVLAKIKLFKEVKYITFTYFVILYDNE